MRMGIDLGGTKIEGIVMNNQGELVAQKRVVTPAALGYTAIVQAIADLVHFLEQQVGTRCSIGIGMPGAISQRTGAIKNCNIVSINGQPLHHDIQNLLQRDVRISNDANCFALSEAVDGAGMGNRVVFGVIMGTGVGAGVIIDQQVHNGPNSIAGEWGHTPLIADGNPCYCGKQGCVETYLSGPGLYKSYLANGGKLAQDTTQLVTLAAAQTDPIAHTTMQHYMNHFGRAIATVIDILDPDIIVLGGGLSNVEQLYLDGPTLIAKHVFSDDLRTPVVRNKFGDSSGVRGAAWLW